MSKTKTQVKTYRRKKRKRHPDKWKRTLSVTLDKTQIEFLKSLAKKSGQNNMSLVLRNLISQMMDGIDFIEVVDNFWGYADFASEEDCRFICWFLSGLFDVLHHMNYIGGPTAFKILSEKFDRRNKEMLADFETEKAWQDGKI